MNRSHTGSAFWHSALRALLICLAAQVVLARGQASLGDNMVYGDFTVDDSKVGGTKPETFNVGLRTMSGIVTARQAVSSGSRYRFLNVKNGEYDIVVELGNEEIARIHIRIEGQKTDFRQDIALEWRDSFARMRRPKPGTISATDYYESTPANQALFQKALNASSKKNYDQAISLLNQIVTSDPKDYVALTELGTLYFKTERLREAEKSYRWALSQQNSYPLALINLGKVQMSEKKYEEAIENLTRAVQKQPNSADANYSLGESYLQIKKGSKAVGYLREAIRLGMPEGHLRLAALYNAAGKKDWAAAEYQQFLQARPDYPDRKTLTEYITKNKKQ